MCWDLKETAYQIEGNREESDGVDGAERPEDSSHFNLNLSKI